MATRKHTHEIHREVGDTELTILVGLKVYSGARATRMDPAESAEIDILWAKDGAGVEVELTEEEVEDITRGEGAIDIFECLADADDAAREDAWELARDR